ncbi:chalcone and stilbene synthase, putative [Bodo saltans]|uniref:Chalcone and stilbene synthase, putative n=1 Tax=Bodo saltans TaxID=75058 RepID=A0A0S4JHU1_BODSA|nr:chalcone and stilbene synthase, putative [Bodo saltans]|eukprot:CUG89703.1 chalcone and stilbene synthase, putative [Bodo saltans]
MPILATPPTMLSVVSAFPETSYTQQEMLELLGVTNPVVKRLLQATHIHKRHLLLPTTKDFSFNTPPMSPSSFSGACLPLTPTSTDADSSVAPSPRAELPVDAAELDMHFLPHAIAAASTAAGNDIQSTTSVGVNITPTSTTTTTTPLPCAALRKETRRELHMRHLRGLSTIGADAARRALTAAGITNMASVSVVVAVTSTGLAMPGFSAILMEQLGLSPSTMRTDVVGMGCNAGMSGLRTLSMMLSGIACMSSAPVYGLLVCCEICSAVYVNDDTTASGIVNSLFGDGAVATVLTVGGSASTLPAADALLPLPATAGLLASSTAAGAAWNGIGLVDFESCTLTEYFEDMRFDVPEEHDRMCFLLSKRIPYAVGDNVATPVLALLNRHQLTPQDVQHWVVHSGGAAVIDGVQRNLGLAPDALRHTVSVLRDYGNISSGSFLVSLERLLEEHQQQLTGNNEVHPLLQKSQLVVFIAMGPGATIEVGLGRLQ